MNTSKTLKNMVLVGTLMAAVMATASTAHAQSPAEASDGLSLGFDVEVDPLAYALEGHSLHVGIWLDRVRLDLGSFGLVVPEALHGNKGFESSFSGFGTKVDLTFNDDRDGIFVGAEFGVARVTTVLLSQQLAETHVQINAGGRVGYKWLSDTGFYVMPWVGVGYAFGADDVTLGGEVFESSPLVVFPTVHVGYQID